MGQNSDKNTGFDGLSCAARTKFTGNWALRKGRELVQHVAKLLSDLVVNIRSALRPSVAAEWEMSLIATAPTPLMAPPDIQPAAPVRAMGKSIEDYRGTRVHQQNAFEDLKILFSGPLSTRGG